MDRTLKAGCRVLAFVVISTISGSWLAADPVSAKATATELIGKPVRIQTQGGGVFQGTLFSVTDERLEIVEADGLIVAIHVSAVSSIAALSMARGTRSLYQDSASNRLMFMPTGFAMAPGELHISDTELAFVTASYGLSEHVSLWAGISPLGAIASARGVLSIGDSVAASAGMFAGIEWQGMLGDQVGGLFLPYLLVSWGEPENNLTIGGSWAISTAPTRGLESRGAVAVIGGKCVLTATTALVSENWLIWAEESTNENWSAVPLFGAFGLAFRIAGNRLSWDIGAIVPLDIAGGIGGIGDGPVVPLPWLSLNYRIR
ncbi:MAG: hypothetical protein ABIJ86_06765 [Spirochaetota bacterium]